ncbi:ABC transporter permease [Actinoplanes capillaceus]|uniref:ABC transporter permease n=1 Tax=Actinoplanes campanulatus TaxID=113559 RepID=A0ABQ3WTN2_9ACTN|nr:iron chelate uptake ABC transporter family permease subunit [Actinoplanes capillaceus]GID49577.1 ABC transporter permease [Actinoplanes capillaceus]
MKTLSPARSIKDVRLAADRVSFRVEPRTLVVCLILILVTAGLVLVSLSVGDYPVPFPEVIKSLQGEGSRLAELFVVQRRLPRALVAVVAGIAFGVSGAIFQRLTHNPLGSPDVIGFGYGASVGAILVILFYGGGALLTATGAFAGGLVAAIAVYVLAYRNGVNGLRLVLVGIGVSAIFIAIINYLVSRADLRDARAATVWIVGSLFERRWGDVQLVGFGLLLLIPITVILSRYLPMLELGDDAAAALGVPLERARLGLVVVAVGLTAIATASTGPIGFVALAGPQLARRLTRSPGAGLTAAGLMGALLLVASDLIARRAAAPSELPVGVVTAGVGGIYLGWLLLVHSRRTT